MSAPEIKKCSLTCQCGGAYGKFGFKARKFLPPWGLGCRLCGKLHRYSLYSARQGIRFKNKPVSYGKHLYNFLMEHKK